MRRYRAAVLTSLLAGASAASAAAPAPAPAAASALRTGPDTRWSKMKEPAPGSPTAIGGYANGCLLGAMPLPAIGGHWVVMRPSRHRYFGHPNLVAFLKRLGDAARVRALPPLFVGDLAQARGGPTLTGHASHQTGLDVDVQYVPPKALSAGALTPQERETLPARAVVDLATGKLTAEWAPGSARLIELAARDPATARIFVHASVKRKLCETVPPKAREPWLGRVRPWWAHHDHFHVRLRCPEGSSACEDQPALPPGDGCDSSLAWWFSAEAKTPPPKKDDAPPQVPTACEPLALPVSP